MPNEIVAQHTPAPWTATIEDIGCDGQPSFVGYIRADNGHQEIAVLYTSAAGSQEANARLIAAAPDLLAAARAAFVYDNALHTAIRQRALFAEAVATCDDLDALYSDWQTKTVLAIAKAEGR